MSSTLVVPAESQSNSSSSKSRKRVRAAAANDAGEGEEEEKKKTTTKKKRTKKSSSPSHWNELLVPVLLHALLPFIEAASLLELYRINRRFYSLLSPSSPKDDAESLAISSCVSKAWIQATQTMLDENDKYDLSDHMGGELGARYCARIISVLVERGCEVCGKTRVRKVQVPFLLRACDECMKKICSRDYELEKFCEPETMALIERLPSQEVGTWSRSLGESSYQRFLNKDIRTCTGQSVEQLRKLHDDKLEEARRVVEQPLIDAIASQELVKEHWLPLDLAVLRKLPLFAKHAGKSPGPISLENLSKDYLLVAGRAIYDQVLSLVRRDNTSPIDEAVLRKCKALWTIMQQGHSVQVSQERVLPLVEQYTAAMTTLAKKAARQAEKQRLQEEERRRLDEEWRRREDELENERRRQVEERSRNEEDWRRREEESRPMREEERRRQDEAWRQRVEEERPKREALLEKKKFDEAERAALDLFMRQYQDPFSDGRSFEDRCPDCQHPGDPFKIDRLFHAEGFRSHWKAVHASTH